MGKIRNLFIPNKTQDPVAQPAYGTDMRTIELFVTQLVASLITEIMSGDGSITVTNGEGPVVNIETAAGTTYASLTGPGEVTTPGALTQHGDLTVGSAGNLTVSDGKLVVSDPGTGGTGIDLTTAQAAALSAAGPIDITGGNLALLSDKGTNIASNGTVSLEGSASAGVPSLAFGQSTDRIQFYAEGTAGGVAFTTVTGSKGGNAALGSLLTLLDHMGLLRDGST